MNYYIHKLSFLKCSVKSFISRTIATSPNSVCVIFTVEEAGSIKKNILSPTHQWVLHQHLNWRKSEKRKGARQEVKRGQAMCACTAPFCLSHAPHPPPFCRLPFRLYPNPFLPTPCFHHYLTWSGEHDKIY